MYNIFNQRFPSLTVRHAPGMTVRHHRNPHISTDWVLRIKNISQIAIKAKNLGFFLILVKRKIIIYNFIYPN